MQQYIGWIKEFFSRNRDLPENVEEINYFEAGLIDSFGVIELVENIETEFGIEFTQADFQDRRFSSIAGLAQLITEKKGLQ